MWTHMSRRDDAGADSILYFPGSRKPAEAPAVRANWGVYSEVGLAVVKLTGANILEVERFLGLHRSPDFVQLRSCNCTKSGELGWQITAGGPLTRPGRPVPNGPSGVCYFFAFAVAAGAPAFIFA